jgi:hypothetical protein
VSSSWQVMSANRDEMTIDYRNDITNEDFFRPARQRIRRLRADATGTLEAGCARAARPITRHAIPKIRSNELINRADRFQENSSSTFRRAEVDDPPRSGDQGGSQDGGGVVASVTPGHKTRRRRISLITVTLVALLAVATGVVAAVGSKPPDLTFLDTGHWVYNEVAKAAFHVDSGTQKADARVEIPDAPTDPVMTLQGKTQGFVVARDRVVVFGKSNLTVDTTIPVDFPETPVGIETVGGPYLVYQETGTVVRLGVPPVTIQTGGKLDRPTYTEDGTVWLHRPDTGAICALRSNAADLDCAVSTPSNVPGSLTVATALPAFVSYAADAAEVIKPSALASPVGLGTDLPDPALLSDRDGGGRLAAVYPDTNRLVLIDSAGVPDNRPGGAPVSVELGPGKFGAPWQCQKVVALLNQAANRVLTYDVNGRQLSTNEIPPGSSIVRGSDCGLFVDNADGTATHIIDSDTGQVTSVSTTPSPNVVGPPPPGQSSPVIPPNPGGSNTTPQPVPSNCTPEHLPANVAFRPSSPAGPAQVTWEQVHTGGAVNYRVTGTGGPPVESRTSPVSWPDLPAGQPYKFTVAAIFDDVTCEASTGDEVAPPPSDLPAPTEVDARLQPDGSVLVTWQPVVSDPEQVSYTAFGSNGLASPKSTSTSASFTNLPTGQPVSFTVEAATPTRTSPRSAPSQEVSTIGPAGAPTNFVNSRTGCNPRCLSTTATLSWSPPTNLGGGVLDHYEITGSQEGRTLPARSPQQSTSASWTAPTEFDPCLPVQFTVKAITRDSGGGPLVTGLPATSSFSHADCTPSATLTVQKIGYQGFTATVKYATFADATCTLRYNSASISTPCGSTDGSGGAGTYSKTVDGLSFETDYSIQVTITNKYKSASSQSVTIRSSPDPNSQLSTSSLPSSSSPPPPSSSVKPSSSPTPSSSTRPSTPAAPSLSSRPKTPLSNKSSGESSGN